jgi:hypothetical protein
MTTCHGCAGYVSSLATSGPFPIDSDVSARQQLSSASCTTGPGHRVSSSRGSSSRGSSSRGSSSRGSSSSVDNYSHVTDVNGKCSGSDDRYKKGCHSHAAPASAPVSTTR